MLWKMEHLLQTSKCSIFHNIFKYGVKGYYMRYFFPTVSNPMETLEWAKEKLKDLKLPEGMEITDLLNMAHGQLEAMGIPGKSNC